MASKYMSLTSSAKTLLQRSPPFSQFLRSIHSLASRQFNAPTVQNSLLHEAAAAAALARDDRVPATVITGFLGSGKVPFSTYSFFNFIIFCLLDGSIPTLQILNHFNFSSASSCVVYWYSFLNIRADSLFWRILGLKIRYIKFSL